MTSTLTAAQRLAGMREIGGAVSRVFVAPEQKILWVSLNKNACTSLKWMMAGLLGEDLDSFQARLLPVTGPQDAIQNRKSWQRAPTLDQLPTAVQEDIDPANGWFVYAVVRDPRNRLFSAWQNKLLLENPGYTHYREQPWYPQHPLTNESVAQDFEKFVTLLEDHPEHRIRQVDPHFRDQAELLMPHLVNYTKIYEISALGDLLTDLRAHLATVGWTGELTLPRSNDTPLRMTGGPFANGVRERVEKIFAADFELFPDRWDFAKVEAAAPWTDAELREADLHAAYGRRIGDLRNIAIEHRNAAAAQRARADGAVRALKQATEAASPTTAAAQRLAVGRRRARDLATKVRSRIAARSRG